MFRAKRFLSRRFLSILASLATRPSVITANIKSNTSVNSGTNTLTLTSVDCTGANLLLVHAFYFDGAGTALQPTVTYNGTAMKFLWTSNNGTDTYLAAYYMLAPPTGAHDVVVTYAGNYFDKTVVAVPMKDVNQTYPFGTPIVNTSTGTSATVTVGATSSSDELCIGFIQSGTVVSSSDTSITSTNDGDGDFTNTSSKNGGGSTVLTWTMASSTWHAGAVPVYGGLGVMIDALIDLHTTTNGTDISAAIWNAGTRGTIGTAGWTKAASANTNVAGTQVTPLHSTFILAGTNFNSSNTDLLVKVDNTHTLQQDYMSLASLQIQVVTISGFIQFGMPDTGAGSAFYDYIQIAATGGHSIILQVDTHQLNSANHYRCRIEQSAASTTRSSDIEVIQNTVYWYSIQYNAVTGTASLALYDTSTWSQISGSPVTLAQFTGEFIDRIYVGHGESGSSATTTTIENSILTWANQVFPVTP